MFKSLFLATALVFSGMAASAQSKQQSTASPAQSNQKRVMTPQERSVRVLRMMTSKVNLSETQQAEVKQILLDREVARAEANKTNSKEAFKAANQKANTKLEAVLSPEQWKLWEEFKTNQKARREQNKANPNNQQTRPEMEEDFY